MIPPHGMLGIADDDTRALCPRDFRRMQPRGPAANDDNGVLFNTHDPT